MPGDYTEQSLVAIRIVLDDREAVVVRIAENFRDSTDLRPLVQVDYWP